MKIHLPVDESSVAQRIEAWVAERFNVFPVDSRKSFEHLEVDGELFRMIPEVFAISGIKSPEDAEKASDMLKQRLAERIPIGAAVQWRSRPILEESNGESTLRCRIGSLFWNQEQPIAKGSHND